MKCIKTRWDLEFPESIRMAENLVDSVKRFKKYRRAGRANSRMNYT